MPGSPERAALRNPGVSQEVFEQTRIRLGLDKPLIPDQLVVFIANTAQGDLGYSFKYRGQPVSEVIGSRVWPTLILFGLGEVIAIVVGLSLGAYAGWRRGGPVDYFGNGLSLILYSMPYFLLGMILLVIFGVGLGWFPVSGMFTLGAQYDVAVGQAVRLRLAPHPAAGHGRPRPHRPVLDPHALVGHRDARRGLRHDGSGQGHRGPPRPAQARHPERDAADGLAHRHQPRLPHRRRHHRRGRLQLARPGHAHGRRPDRRATTRSCRASSCS